MPKPTLTENLAPLLNLYSLEEILRELATLAARNALTYPDIRDAQRVERAALFLTDCAEKAAKLA